MRRIVLGALALVLVAVVVLRPWADDPGSDEADEPAARDGRDVPTYRIGDAEPVVAGQHYRLVREIPGEIGYQAEVLLPDGDLVLVDRWSEDRPLVRVWDPATGEQEMVPKSWRDGPLEVTATSATDLWITFGPTYAGKLRIRNRHVVHYDRTTARTRTVRVPHPARAKSRHHVETPPQVGSDGRIYFLTGSEFCYRPRCSTPDDRELWSFAPGNAADVRREATNVGQFAASQDLVAWSDPYENLEDGTAVLQVRKVGTDRVRTARVGRCADEGEVPPIQVTDDRVLLACGRVYDDRARLVADLNVYHHGLSGLTDSWIAWGWTLWNPRTGVLLRTADDRVLWHERRVVMRGDVVLLPSLDGPRNLRSSTWKLVRLRG